MAPRMSCVIGVHKLLLSHKILYQFTPVRVERDFQMVFLFERIKFIRQDALIEDEHLYRQPILDVMLAALLEPSFLGPEHGRPRLHNDDIVKLACGRLPESVLVRVVELYRADFDMSQTALLNLRQSCIGNRVIDAMLSKELETAA